jgi:hypothetical protein
MQHVQAGYTQALLSQGSMVGTKIRVAHNLSNDCRWTVERSNQGSEALQNSVSTHRIPRLPVGVQKLCGNSFLSADACCPNCSWQAGGERFGEKKVVIVDKYRHSPGVAQS